MQLEGTSAYYRHCELKALVLPTLDSHADDNQGYQSVLNSSNYRLLIFQARKNFPKLELPLCSASAVVLDPANCRRLVPEQLAVLKIVPGRGQF